MKLSVNSVNNERAVRDEAIKLNQTVEVPETVNPGATQNSAIDSPPRRGENYQSPVRERVLVAACELFAECGYHGTHLREICKRAGTNVAGVCYYFRSKEGLYQSVIMEAGRQLSADDGSFAACRHLPPDQRLQKLTESLLNKLGAKRAWIAKLLARELMDTVGGLSNYAASGLEKDFVLLRAVMKPLTDPTADAEQIRLQAFDVIGACIIYSLSTNNPRHPLSQSGMCLPGRMRYIQFVVESSLGTLRVEHLKTEGTNL